MAYINPGEAIKYISLVKTWKRHCLWKEGEKKSKPLSQKNRKTTHCQKVATLRLKCSLLSHSVDLSSPHHKWKIRLEGWYKPTKSKYE